MKSFLVLASLVGSVLSYQVVRPSQTSGWTNQGPQTITWDRVNTDPESFAILLTNVNRNLLPSDILLAAQVDGASASSITVQEPEGGWPSTGGSYRVNLIKSERELNTILAQSNEFNITAGASSASTSSASKGSSITISVQGSASAPQPLTRTTSSVRDATVSGMIAPDDIIGGASGLQASLAAAVLGAATLGSMLL